MHRVATRSRVVHCACGFSHYNDHFMDITPPVAMSHSPADLDRARVRRNRRLFLAIIVLVWAVIYVSTIFRPALMDDADTVHAEAAREMATSGDWVTLRINGGFRYLEKSSAHVLACGRQF